MSDVTRIPVTDRSYVGLDLSLTSTGFALKQGQVISLESIKTEPKDFPNDLARMAHIRDVVLRKIPIGVSMVCAEDFFSGFPPGSGIRLAMLAAIVRLALFEKKMSVMVVSPSSLKKYILGKGSGQKSLILRETYRRYGIDCKNDDEADAAVLCHIAEHLFCVMGGSKVDDAPKYQQEVIKGLIAARKERGYNLL